MNFLPAESFLEIFCVCTTLRGLLICDNWCVSRIVAGSPDRLFSEFFRDTSARSIQPSVWYNLDACRMHQIPVPNEFSVGVLLETSVASPFDTRAFALVIKERKKVPLLPLCSRSLNSLPVCQFRSLKTLMLDSITIDPAFLDSIGILSLEVLHLNGCCFAGFVAYVELTLKHLKRLFFKASDLCPIIRMPRNLEDLIIYCPSSTSPYAIKHVSGPIFDCENALSLKHV
jgi:hypothetical protein